MEAFFEYQMHHDLWIFFSFIMLYAPTSRPGRVSTVTVVPVIVLKPSSWPSLGIQACGFRSFARFACNSVHRFQGNSATNTSSIFIVVIFSLF